MRNIFFYDTILGKVGIADNGSAITNLYFNIDSVDKDMILIETELIKKAFTQLEEYLCKNRTHFEIPLSPCGTQFMKSVWNELKNIQYGKTCAYGEIAEKIGNPKAARAVGLANNKNPIPIFIPCHRVIGKNGKLVGYSGGLDIKEKLLYLECSTNKTVF
ncbi:methylated-DNA--[protein]-cysteine S-methyltransferase [uncultured Clostridium sp.]|uniref:methylated-DNA--[protein]-cysteine S-methyltransferase n=1 Tax=uncultured Clostridium sp. TaxID=59620 RepID=UPI0028E1BABC|nr:methylated-DNA--[protein]-cysteine S-methyltransferase [uncultured Clostridium sp.]